MVAAVYRAHDGPGFAPEALSRRQIAVWHRYRLEGDLSIEARVARRVHDTHAALPALAQDLIVAKLF